MSNLTTTHDIYDFTGWSTDNASCPLYYEFFNSTDPAASYILLGYVYNLANSSIYLLTNYPGLIAQSYVYYIRGYVHPDLYVSGAILFAITDNCATIAITNTSIVDVVYDTGDPDSVQSITPWTTNPDTYCE